MDRLLPLVLTGLRRARAALASLPWARATLIALLVAAALTEGLMGRARGAIVIGNQAGNYDYNTTTITWSHTVGSGTDRILVVRVGNVNSTVTVSSVTYGGTALTSLASATSGSGAAHARASIWYLVAPPVGTATVLVTLSAKTWAIGNSDNYSGVSQYAPFGTTASAAGSSTAAALTVASATGDLVLDAGAALGSAGAATGGSGQTISSAGTGTTATDVLVFFSTKAGAAASTPMSWTLTNSSPWVDLGVALKPSYTVSGTVFEDVNYGGGAGRNLASSSGVGLTGATVELYSSTGSYLASTTTASGGGYTFTGLSGSGSYYVRVVNTSADSQRSGSTPALTGVQTYRTNAGTGTAVDVTDSVGGTNPALADPGAASSGAAFSTSTFVYSAGLTGTAQSVAPVTLAAANVTGVDFGFNFDTVVNTNDTGQGSLRQAITNANTLGGDSSLAQSGRTAAIENIVFMISNGTAGSGLRSAYNYFTTSAGAYNVATISPASLLPTITSALVLDAQTQPGWSLAPLIELNGTSAGSTTTSNGLQPLASNCVIRGFVINRFKGEGIYSSTGNNLVLQGNYIGTNAAGTAASGNNRSGIYINTAASTGHQIGGTTAAQRNVLSGNTRSGLALSTTSSTLVQGNYIGVNASASGLLGNGQSGVDIGPTASGNTIGGTAAGAGNVIAGNTLNGITVPAGASGIAIEGNSIYGNSGLGIDLDADSAVNVNDGAKTSGKGNLDMDYPVFTVASLSGSTLTVAGYVGSAAGQSTFASARVEVFVSDNDGSGYGEGQTYLGFLTTDASGNFSGTLSGVSGVTAGTTKITGTATDGSGNTSEFGANVTIGLTIAGTVFEDGNYGGGAGRSLATSSGSGLGSATVELYNSSGTYVTETTTASGGGYSFTALAAGTYYVRVVNSTVQSARSGTVSTLRGVMTYRTDASGGSATAVTNYVGGTNPALVDPGTASSGAAFNTTTGVYSSGLTGTAQSYAKVVMSTAGVAGVDFGFNFDTVVNTNDTGQGSLRQAMTNANTLGGDSSLAQSGLTAAIENLVFMISNGSTASGLRSTYNYFTTSAGAYNVATIAPASALPTVTSPLVIDAQIQPGWALAPIVELNGSGAGSAVSGLVVNAAGSIVRGLVINRYTAEGVTSTAGAGLVIQGNYIGTNAAGTAASGNTNSGVWINNSAGGHLIGGTTAAQRNVISGNSTQEGVALLGGAGNVIQGNYIGVNAAGTGVLANGRHGVKFYAGVSASQVGGTAAGAGNIIAGNVGNGVTVITGATGCQVLGNSIYGNGSLGIDLDNDGVTANDGAKTSGRANLDMDFPVFTTASLSGTTLTVTGYVGSAANQSTFASARVEVFVSDVTSANGQGKTYLGFLTTDANGNFSGTLSGISGVTAGTSKITGTATDSSNDSSEFGPNFLVTLAITGTVFEDVNYGGGSGRSLAASSGVGLNGATVELYNSGGTYVSSTTTAGGGSYAFYALAAGTYYVRVANTTVASQRSGSVGTLRGVMTYRTDASGGSAAAVTTYVGGTNPALVDPGTASSGAVFSTSTFVYSAGLSGTAQSVTTAVLASTSGISGVDFGFNFDTVVNTNASGQGSLAQAITNANTLGGDASLAQASGTGVGTARTSGVENIVFMISNGTTASGLRSSYNYFSSGVATITPTAALLLPTLSTPMIIDAQTQPGWTANPVIDITGASAGSNNGITVSGGGSTLRGLIVRNFSGGQGGIYLSAGTGSTVQGCWVGVTAAGSAAAANSYGLWIASNNNTVGGASASLRNVISGNSGSGVVVWTGADTNSILGNYIGLNAAGTAAVGNTQDGIVIFGTNVKVGGVNAGEGNVIAGNNTGATSTQGGVETVNSGSATIRGNLFGLKADASATIASNGTAVIIGTPNNTVGGTAAGAGNTITAYTLRGVGVNGTSTTGVTIEGNSIYGNGIGIDLASDGATANHSTTTASQPNLLMDYPIFTSASLSGSTLTVAGYVGSAANQSAFASARVEVFISDVSNAAGQGKTYLGFLTSDASGNFSGTISGVGGVTANSSKITGTATSSAGNTSEFGTNFTVLGPNITGTVFEDVNYGGGAGRNLAASGGTGLANATVELYNSSGVYVSSKTTASGGSYTFTNISAGSYYIRVASSTVVSQRSGSVNTLRGVMTYRADASSGTASDVTDYVGGTNPALVDPGTASSGATFSTSTYVYSAGLSGTAQAVTPVTIAASNVTGVDFGFNFDTVVNTNATGQGSLNQAIVNANTLGGDAALAQAGRTASVENVVFMISNGSAGSGLRSAYNYFSGGVATIQPNSSLLATVSSTLVIDAQLQPGWTLAPIIQLDGSNAGTSSSSRALQLTAANCVLRGFVVNRFYGDTIYLAGNGITVQGNYIGTDASGASASANQRAGILVASGYSGLQIGGTSASQRNVISGNGREGVYMASGSSNIQGNYIGVNAANTATIANGTTGSFSGVAIGTASPTGITVGGTAAGAGNVIAASTGAGVGIPSGATGVTIEGNSIYSNASGKGIDLNNDGVTANDGATTAGGANLLTDKPVLTSVSLAGTSLSVSGYVGSAPSQSKFAGNRVEIFISDNDASGYGQGKTYLGYLTTDASGNLSGTLTGVSGVSAGTTKITATATDASGNTSEFSAQTGVGMVISGTVFEDVNYGGGAGRSLAASAGVGVAGATVELYNSSGSYVAKTTTASGGGYSFSLGAGTYYVRVVGSTVASQRSGSVGTLAGVLTYRCDASSGSAVDVTNVVGGSNPALADAASASAGAALNTTTGVFSAGPSGTAQALAPVTLSGASATGVNFGYNFDTVVNTNDSGAGSLRQAITNANALAGDASLAQSGRTAGIENLVFMISNGSNAAGLRSTYNYFTTAAGSYNVATIAPSSALPALSTAMVIDAQTQPGWSANPIVEINGTGAGSVNGFNASASGSTVRGLVINRFAGGAGVAVTAGSTTVQGCWIGLAATGSTKQANSVGILVTGASGNQIGGTAASAGNVVSGNTGDGIRLTGAGATANLLRGNTIGTDAGGTTALGNGGNGIAIAGGAAGNTVGGATAGAPNLIRGNVKGVVVSGSGSGNWLTANSIYGNSSIGIDLGDDGATANDGAVSSGQPNLLIDAPVFTTASFAGTTLTVAGYIGTAPGQSVFAGARVEVFVSDASNAAGQGQTYLGNLTADASGNFSGTITVLAGLTNGTTVITATASDGSGNTSEFGPNLTPGYAISGTVFEDVNYGGGAGRSLAASGGTAAASVRVELYDASGSFITATTTAAGGGYSFTSLAAGNYTVRVASQTVTSSRSGSTAALRAVLTFRTSAASGSAVAATDQVGGTNPAAADPGSGSSGTAFNPVSYVFGAGLAGTANAVAPVTVAAASIAGIDFGFNFDTVVNTNDSGQGSLRQAITNANALAGDNLLAQSGRSAGIENLVFMIANGSAAPGLRSAYNYFTTAAGSGSVATITPTSALPAVSASLVIDASTQPGWSANPVLELRGSSAGSADGLTLTAGSTTVRGFVVNRWTGNGIVASSGSGDTLQSNWIGVTADGGSAAANSGAGIALAGPGGGHTIGGSGAANVVSGNGGAGVRVSAGSSGNAIVANSIYGNVGLGIDLNGDGVSVNDGVKTAGAGNLLMDQPVFSSARARGSQLTVAGWVGSAAGQSTFGGARIDLYASDGHSSGYGAGKTWLGTLTADASGNFSGTVTMAVSTLALGSQLTGTATDGSNNTSEFGANFTGVIVDLVVNSNLDEADTSAGDGKCLTASGVCTLRAAIAELNAWPGLTATPTVVFAIPGCSSYGSAGCTIAPATALPSLTRTALIDATTQSGWNSSTLAPIIALDGATAPAAATGLVLAGGGSTLRGIAITRFGGNGLAVSGSGNLIAGDRFGLDPLGAAAANGGAGVSLSGSGNTVGGTTAADRNLIAANTGNGVLISASGNSVLGNAIGTDASGSTGLGNGGSGVQVQSGVSGATVSANTIANNGGRGVNIANGATQVQVTVNAISGNGALGIDLGNDGVTANTGSTSSGLANNGINQPVVTGAGVGTGATSLALSGYIGTGSGQAAFAGARVEIFKAAADPSGYGEGLLYLGALTADASGRFSGTLTLTGGQLAVGDSITATATDGSGNTSEFGANWTTTTMAALTPGGFNAFETDTAGGAIAGVIRSKTAGSAATLAVIALDSTGTALHPGFTGSVSLSWLDARDDSAAVSGSCRSSWISLGAAGSAVFSNNSRVNVSVTPPATATRAMRLKMTYSNGGTTSVACSGDAFAALPAQLSWVNASDADSGTAGTARVLSNTAASGGVVHRAGRPFTVRAQALDATGALMTGYDGSPVLTVAGCLLPSGCSAGALTSTTAGASGGVYTNSTVSYADVGAIQLLLTDAGYAAVDSADTPLATRTLTSATLAAGRFVPDSLSVALATNGKLATANGSCLASGQGATFYGQGFGWSTVPQVTVTALNAAGATTALWTGSLMKLSAASGLTPALAVSGAGSATLAASYGAVAVQDLGGGQARIGASATDLYMLQMSGSSVQASTTPAWTWQLAVADASEAAVGGNPTLSATASQSPVGFDNGAVFHSGRLALAPGHGDARSGVRLLVQLQRWTSAGWVTMTEDRGCVAVLPSNVGVESPSGVFGTAGVCAAPLQAGVTTLGGRAWLALPGTPAAAAGRLTLRLAGAAATGNSCTAGGASAALVALAQPWLLGGSSASGPAALATWGKPNRDTVLRRETW